MIFDTDVLIFAHRGNTKASDIIVNTDDRQISIITYMELLQGARDKKHLKIILRFIRDFGFEVLNINANIGNRALLYVEIFCLSHKMVMADALIAATAVEYNKKFISANVKHFSFIPELDLCRFYP